MIIRLESTTSTMTDAAELAARGAAHGTVVVARQQTGGIGRQGHTWHSAPDGGLYLSMILRLPGSGPALTLALGLAIQDAVTELAGITPDLRWPNDAMVSGRKLAGILVQASGGALIAGIGLNVNQTSFPGDLASVATSLRLETGSEFSLDSGLELVRRTALQYAELETPEVLRLFESRSSYARGKMVEVEGRFRGVTAGLDPTGFLLVRTATGLETVLAGGVREL